MKRKISKNLVIITGALALVLSAPTISQAGQWIKEDRGWRYQYTNGTYATGVMPYIDGNQDGIWERYLFDDDGYLITDYVRHIDHIIPFVGRSVYDECFDSEGRLLNNDGTVHVYDVREVDAKVKAFMIEQSNSANYMHIGEGKIRPEIKELFCQSEEYVKAHYMGTIEEIVDRGQKGDVRDSSIKYTNGVEFKFQYGYLDCILAKNPSLLFIGVADDDSLQKVIDVLGPVRVNEVFPDHPELTSYVWEMDDPMPSGYRGICVYYNLFGNSNTYDICSYFPYYPYLSN